MGQADSAGDEPASAQDRLCELHNRLVSGDPVASEQIVQLALRPVLRVLERRWSKWRHTDALYDAAIDALLDYIDAPERFDPERGGLVNWLVLAAHRDLINLQVSGKQRTALETLPLSALTAPDTPIGELPPGVMPISMARLGLDPGDPGRLDNLDMWRRIREACPEERERELIWACWVEGERSSDRLAHILGVQELPMEERRSRVKNARDIAKRKLKRMGLIDDGQD